MSVPTTTTADVAQVLASVLGDVPDLRVAWYVSDASRPPVAVIAQPEIVYDDPDTPFCFGTYYFPVAIVVSRSQDLAAQQDLSRFVFEVARALSDADPNAHGVFSIEPLSARPAPITVSGTELPGYELRVRVRA